MDISKIFEEYTEKDEAYMVAYDIVRRNSKGKTWLIRGGVSRNLNRLIYGVPQDSFDFDFVVEKKLDEFKLPEGWIEGKNSFGNPKLVNGAMEIDFIPIDTVESIIRKELTPTIENVLFGVPFGIQALAYDCGAKVVIGEVGLKAFRDRVFGVNDLGEARLLCDRKGIGINDLILKKAGSMGFEAVLV